jgi:hypothetical protein
MGTVNNLISGEATVNVLAACFVALPLQPVATQEGRLRQREQ